MNYFKSQHSALSTQHSPSGQTTTEFVVVLALLTLFGIYFMQRMVYHRPNDNKGYIPAMAQTVGTKIADDQ